MNSKAVKRSIILFARLVVLASCNGTNGAMTRVDGPCFNDTTRYVDCGNGTVTDTVTGLIWLKNAGCLGSLHWAAANGAAAALADGQCGILNPATGLVENLLTDHSSPGDWRLPTRDEWKATIARAIGATSAVPVLHCIPSLTDTIGKSCFGNGSTSAFVGVAASSYWTSTTDEEDTDVAWVADLYMGTAHPGFGGDGLTQFLKNGPPPTGTNRVWAVRGSR